MATDTESQEKKNGSKRAIGRRVSSEVKLEEDSTSKVLKNVDQGNSEQGGESVTKKSPKKRRKVNHACVYCRRSHMTCDLERPCTRCIKRNIGHLCHDEPRDPDSKKGKGAGSEDQLQDGSISNTMGPPTTTGFGNPLAPLVPLGSSSRLAGGNTTDGGGANGNSNQFAGFSDAWMTAQNFPEMAGYTPNYLIAPEVSHEFNFLNDFLHTSMLDDNGGAIDESQQQDAVFNSSSNTGNNSAGQLDMLPSPYGNNHDQNARNGGFRPNTGTAHQQSRGLPAPVGALGAPASRSSNVLSGDKDKTKEYYLQAADPTGNDTPEERMERVLRAKFDAGLLRPFNYIKGYSRLHKYLDGHIASSSKQKIGRTIQRFRPMFREKAQVLTDMQLVYVEMWFEKQLMEYDRVFASMAVPACCWRRTGEIFRGNQEMAELIHVPVDSLRDGKIALHEILTEESMVRYWEEFGTIAFDPSHDTLLTACSLKNPSDDSNFPIVKCCFSFNIRRDEHKLPALIVGNFLPHDPLSS